MKKPLPLGVGRWRGFFFTSLQYSCMPLTGHTYVNRAGGSRLNHQQPYRTVIRIGGDESSALPPACFFTVAIQQLRADATERVLILADSGSAWNLAGSVVAALQAATPPPPSSPPPSNKQKAISSAADIVHECQFTDTLVELIRG